MRPKHDDFIRSRASAYFADHIPAWPGLTHVSFEFDPHARLAKRDEPRELVGVWRRERRRRERSSLILTGVAANMRRALMIGADRADETRRRAQRLRARRAKRALSLRWTIP